MTFIWQVIRTLNFYFWFFLFSFFIILNMFFSFLNKKAIKSLITIWGKGVLWILKTTLDLEVECILDESHKNIMPKNCIIASEHQSVLEIIVFTAIFEDITFIAKKTLKYIPLIGIILHRIGIIFVDRKKFNKNWLNDSEKALKNGKTLIIFPEGTRTKFNEEIPYKKGVFKLAEQMKKQIIPIAINTGLYWPRKSFFKKKGKAKIVIGPYINPDPEILRAIYKDLL